MSWWFWVFVATYVWAGFWTGVISGLIIQTSSTLERVMAGVFFAAIWPLALPLHVGDVDRLNRRGES